MWWRQTFDARLDQPRSVHRPPMVTSLRGALPSRTNCVVVVMRTPEASALLIWRRVSAVSSACDGTTFLIRDSHLTRMRLRRRHNRGLRYYKARVAKRHADGRYDLDYDDGDRELHVSPCLVRHRGDQSRGIVGTLVEAHHRLERGRKITEKGVIKAQGGDKFTVLFDNGDTAEISHKLIKVNVAAEEDRIKSLEA